jgi:hypothetical protein
VEKGKITVNVNSAVDFESVSFMPKTQQKYGVGMVFIILKKMDLGNSL